MRARPFTHKKTLVFFIIAACLAGLSIDYGMGTRVDYWLHDSALVYQQRQEWKYAGIVVLDDDVPFRVTRIQALPLFARAVEHLIAQGAKGVYLDARVSKQVEGRMPYAVCLESNGEARWSQPQCTIGGAENPVCTINNSESGNAPLKMSPQAITRFRLAPYLDDDDQLPEFLLYDLEAAEAIPAAGLVSSDRLVTQSSPIARWLDMSEDHAVFKLASLLAPEKIAKLYGKNRLDEVCDNGRRCRRVRLSKPIYQVSSKNSQLILPLSQLASCDEAIANKTAALLKNKVVVLQATSPSEATDIMVTPMTSALFGPQLMTPGAQYLVDELETVLNQDFPRSPQQAVRIAMIVCAAALSVLSGAYFSEIFLWSGAALVFLGLAALCFLNPVTQLWPVTAVMAAYLIGAMQIVSVHLVLGVRDGRIIKQFFSQQIIDLLQTLKNPELFRHRHCNVVVLMSDLAGYTTITGLLKEPESVMDLMNDYLGATSLVLQQKYNGVLEAYVGDMVCYYWEYEEDEKQIVYERVLCAAVELALLQKNFFSSVATRFNEVLTPDVVLKISSTINAGIGITDGKVVKGYLGPKEGVKKFAILGDPLNLASRIESLTRVFNTEIIIAGDFAKTAAGANFAFRRLGAIIVKGRTEPAILYALGKKTDPRFSPEHIKAWEQWLAEIENRTHPTIPCPEIYGKDQETILAWQKRGVLGENGVWQLHEK